MLNTRIVVALTTLAVTLPLFASTPENFIYTSSGDLDAAAALIARRDIGGAQIVYNWRALEPVYSNSGSLLRKRCPVCP